MKFSNINKVILFFSKLNKTIWQVLFVDSKNRYAETQEVIDMMAKNETKRQT